MNESGAVLNGPKSERLRRVDGFGSTAHYRFLIAAAATVLGFAVGLHLPGELRCAASAVLAGSMVLVATIDVAEFRVPDRLSYSTFLLGLVATGLTVQPGFSAAIAMAESALSAAICAGVMLTLRETFYRARGYDGLGLGDVKLSLAGGAWLGCSGFAFAILIASVAGIAFIAYRAASTKGWARSTQFPFAAALAPSFWLVWIASASLQLGTWPPLST